jgi:hypothetical protein
MTPSLRFVLKKIEEEFQLLLEVSGSEHWVLLYWPVC